MLLCFLNKLSVLGSEFLQLAIVQNDFSCVLYASSHISMGRPWIMSVLCTW
ncbi:hypothetical protein X975_01749, partial [Stegodyphus mimosarum]